MNLDWKKREDVKPVGGQTYFAIRKNDTDGFWEPFFTKYYDEHEAYLDAQDEMLLEEGRFDEVENSLEYNQESISHVALVNINEPTI